MAAPPDRLGSGTAGSGRDRRRRGPPSCAPRGMSASSRRRGDGAGRPTTALRADGSGRALSPGDHKTSIPTRRTTSCRGTNFGDHDATVGQHPGDDTVGVPHLSRVEFIAAQTGVGSACTAASTRRATSRSLDNRTGPPTACAASGITPLSQHRISYRNTRSRPAACDPTAPSPTAPRSSPHSSGTGVCSITYRPSGV